jgi:hypothetical protein
MSMIAKLPVRFTGVLLLAASGGTTLLHRSTYQAAAQGSAQVAEMGIGLLTFLLASAGVLMLIHGAKLFEGKLGSGGRGATPSKLDALARRGDAPAQSDGTATPQRVVALMQARRVITAAHSAPRCSARRGEGARKDASPTSLDSQ